MNPLLYLLWILPPLFMWLVFRALTERTPRAAVTRRGILSRMKAWPWKWILGPLAVLGIIWYFWSTISSSAGSTNMSVGTAIGSVGAIVWVSIAVAIVLIVIIYFYRWKGVKVSFLTLLALGTAAAAWHIGSSADFHLIDLPTDWRNEAQLKHFADALWMPALACALAMLAVLLPLAFLLDWRKVEKVVRKASWWLVGASVIVAIAYLAFTGYRMAAMIGIGVVAAVFAVFRDKGWVVITSLAFILVGFMAWNRFWVQPHARFDHAVELRSTSRSYSAKEMRELQKGSRRGVELYRCSFTPVDGDEWWHDTQYKTLPEVWDYLGGHLSFTIHWSYGQTIFVDLYNSPSENIARGTWTWFEDGGVKVLARGNAELGTPVPDPTGGPEVGGTLVKIPRKRANDSELKDVQFVLRFPETLREYHASVEKKL